MVNVHDPKATSLTTLSGEAKTVVPDVPIEEKWLKAPDGVKLYIKKWLVPEGTDLKARIVYNHGFSEHTGCYDHFFPFFAEAGYEVTAYDQRGAGRTSPSRSTVGVTNEYHVFRDLDQIIETEVLSDDYTGKLFMFGHSMGGGISLNYAVKGEYREKFDGFLVTSPLIEVHPSVVPNRLEASLAPLIAKVWPKYSKRTPAPVTSVCNDPEMQLFLSKDPLNSMTLTAGMANDFLIRGRRLKNTYFVEKFIERPVVVYCTSGDLVTDCNATKEFYGLLKVSDKKLVDYDTWMHSLYLMLPEQRHKHRDDVLEWLDAHLEGPSHLKQASDAAAAAAKAKVDAKAESDAAAAKAESEAAAKADAEAATKAEADAAETGPAVESSADKSVETTEETAEETAEEPTAEESAVKEAVVEDTPAEDTPAEEPAVKEPVVEEPAVEETPVEETPVEQPAETPAKETPAEETPAEETPAEETPAEETPAEETPADDHIAEEPASEEPTAIPVKPDETPAPEDPAAADSPEESAEGTPEPEESPEATETKAAQTSAPKKKKKNNKKKGKK